MPSATGKRVIAFIQSVRPADPAHVLLLFGATFLFIAHRLRWWPLQAAGSPGFVTWVVLASWMTFLVVAAGVVAGYLCLLSVREPLRFLMCGVLLPALVALLAIPLAGFIWFPQVLFAADPGAGSIFDTSSRSGVVIVQALWSLGPGPPIAVLGFGLVAIFAVLLRSGRTTLPVRLRFSRAGSTGEVSPSEDRRTAIFVWMMVCLVPLVGFLTVGLVFVADWMIPGFDWARPGFSSGIEQVIDAASLLPLVVIALGAERIKVLRNSIRLPPPEYVGIAVLIPAALACVWPMARFFLDVNHYFVGLGGDQPKLGVYIAGPDPSLLWFLVPAFVEEIAWRGYLQPRLVRRYGVVRGIFFVGIVWGAFHFANDFGSRMSAGAVVLHIGERLTETVAQSYVLGWLTMRSRSILPAALTHGVFNMSLAAGFLRGLGPSQVWVISLAWAIVGYLLFRHLPPQAEKDETITDSAPDAEAAT